MTNKLLSFFYKWHRLEKANDIDIIWADRVQRSKESPGKFKDRDEAKKTLVALIKEYDKNPKRDEFISAKLKASLYYLRALMGEEIPFSEYVLNTMGLKPKYISEDDLEEQLRETKEAYKSLGYKYEREDLLRYEKDNLQARQEIKQAFNSFRNKFVPEFLKWLSIDVELDFETRFVSVDGYWKIWITTNDKGELEMRFNVNKRQKWTKGVVEAVVLHEICGHMVHAAVQQERLDKGDLHPVIGLTTPFTPDQFLSEGIAESLHFFYPTNPLSAHGKVYRYWRSLDWFVMNNVHIMANEGERAEKIAKYVKRYLPTMDVPLIKKRIKEKTKNPLYRTYQYIYGIAGYYHKKIAEKLSKEQRREYLLNAHRNVYTPQEILKQYRLI